MESITEQIQNIVQRQNALLAIQSVVKVSPSLSNNVTLALSNKILTL